MKNTQLTLPPLRFIPGDFLPPEEAIKPTVIKLAEAIVEKSRHPLEQGFVLDILRLTQPHGSILGSAKTLQGLPAGCFLATRIAVRENCPDAIGMIHEIGRVLGDGVLGEQFPEIHRKPSQGKNTLLHVHLALGGSPVYPLIALELQQGVLAALEKAAWQQTPRASKTLSALISSLLRVVPLLPEQEFSEAWQAGDPMRCAGTVEGVIRSLPRLRGGGRDRPLAVRTVHAYLRDIALLLNRPEWLHYESSLGGMGESILAEQEEEIEALHARGFQKAADRTSEELDPGISLEPDYWEPASRRYAFSSERALLDEYPSLIRYSTTPPNIAAEILRVILTQKSNGDPGRFRNRILILSYLLLGRSDEFLKRIVTGPWPEHGERLENPRYVPEYGCVVYDPEDCVHGLPTAVRGRKNSYSSVSPFWILPLPAPLQRMWRLLAQDQKEVRLFEGLNNEEESFRGITDWVRRKFPGTPIVTKARLRSAFTALMLCVGKMDPLLAAFISGQWRIAHRAPLFYTTITSDLLQERFSSALRLVWDFLREIQPVIPDYSDEEVNVPEEIWMGSPYKPEPAAVRRMIDLLQRQVREADNDEERHNRRTVLLLFLLAVVAGLRFGEASALKAIHFDLDVTYEEKPLPWLVIDQAKGNWFTTAARVVPLTPKLAKLAGSVIASDRSQPAFYFLENGRSLPATATILHDRLEAVRSAIRWHSGRHFLRSWLCAQGVEFDLTNALMGHQSQGRELLNPHLPNEPWTAWREMSGLMEKLLDELGVEVEP